MRLTVIACLAALASAGPAYAGGATAAQCEAATAAMPEAMTGVANTFYSTGAPGPISPTLSRHENPHQNWHGRTPKPATLAALERVLNTSALSCSSALEIAAQRGTILSDDEGQRRLKAMGLNGITAYFHRVSLPALDPEGREAIVAIASTSNQLAGGVRLYFLEKVGSQWEIVGQKVLVVS
ncbi:hypothetical protein M9M90_12565 [Phenylobacterium sp. LH3H17]|uniref:hypothetical protein n=1 Tax=Phenylobacterium sp. LH3H17 TaxID=2903901 RepID=UPI0020C9A33B|nr:hypothetical protein [Phenylobacterium sp. LH3H17]UTP38065.1 hypothetical protein M9M90_12565 [Phenylobacterium sp. LH3H17]